MMPDELVGGAGGRVASCFSRDCEHFSLRRRPPKTVKQASKWAISPLLCARRRHHKAPLRGAKYVLTHGTRCKDGDRIMWRIVHARAGGCRAVEPTSSSTPATQLQREEQQEPKQQLQEKRR